MNIRLARFMPSAVVLLVVFALAGESLLAGFRRDPMPHAITSPAGDAVFVIVPAKEGGFGVCYGINNNGEFVERWRTSGWYSEDLELGNDGLNLVRTGSWQSYDQEGRRPLESLAIAFYHRGELMKQYKVGDLVMDPASLISSSAGVRWLGESRGLGVDGKYNLITTDGFEYVFNASSGLLEKRTNRFPVIHESREQSGSLITWRLPLDIMNSLEWNGAGEAPFNKEHIHDAVYEWMMLTYGALAYGRIEIHDPVRSTIAAKNMGWYYIVDLSDPMSEALPAKTQVVLSAGGRFAFREVNPTGQPKHGED